MNAKQRRRIRREMWRTHGTTQAPPSRFDFDDAQYAEGAAEQWNPKAMRWAEALACLRWKSPPQQRSKPYSANDWKDMEFTPHPTTGRMSSTRRMASPMTFGVPYGGRGLMVSAGIPEADMDCFVAQWKKMMPEAGGYRVPINVVHDSFVIDLTNELAKDIEAVFGAGDGSEEVTGDLDPMTIYRGARK